MSSFDSLVKSVNSVILDPKYAELLKILKGTRNGAVYGAKVRFPHALVMVFLFRNGTFQEKVNLVMKATRTHAKNLAKFVTIYKTMVYLLKRFGPNNGKESSVDTFIAGLLGGYIVFGQANPRTGRVSSVSQQIVIYVAARVVLGLAKLTVTPGTAIFAPPELSDRVATLAWPLFASLSWGGVMWLFRWYPQSLQSSLASSMTYLYRDSDHWDGVRTLVWHNK